MKGGKRGWIWENVFVKVKLVDPWYPPPPFSESYGVRKNHRFFYGVKPYAVGTNLSMAEKSLQKSVPRFLFGGNAPINWVRK